MGRRAVTHGHATRRSAVLFLVLLSFVLVLGVLAVPSVNPQVETITAAPQAPVWVSRGRVEGHLALSYSPAGAFSPDGSTLAVVVDEKIALFALADATVRKILKPHLADVVDLQFQSANFLDPEHILLFGNGLMRVKGEKPGGPTPFLAFQWDVKKDVQFGKLNGIGMGGGFGPARYFPQIRYLALYKESHFDFWNPATGRGDRVELPVLTREPKLYEFCPDGHWLLLAQIEGSSTADPVVVRLKEHQFVDALRGHKGTVLGMNFSRDAQKVVTACEDGKVRLWSVADWKLLATLEGHFGPVHWAEFSPDGQWVVSGGEDRTVRVWSGQDGAPVQTLEEAQAPVLSVAFSPLGDSIAASTEKSVLVWQRQPR